MDPLSPEVLLRLETEKNLWVASTRADGRPHLVPVWFVYHEGKVYLSIQPGSAKARNLQGNPHLALALEGGTSPVICEGEASFVTGPVPESVRDLFLQKYEWDLRDEDVYTLLVEVAPVKWLAW